MADARKDVQKKEAQAPEHAERTRAARVYTPLVDIVETKDDILVTADMPGVDEKTVDINLEKDILSIYGTVDYDGFEKYRPLYAEYGIGDYQRSFTLSDEIDRERIQASVKNGVLKIVLPKAQAVKNRKIAVQAGA